MKNFTRVITIAFILICTPAFSQQHFPTITYEITARNLSLEAVNTYPQQLIDSQYEDSLYRITVTTFAAHKDTIKRAIVYKDVYSENKTYSEDVMVYLETTPLINYNLPEIEQVTDSIVNSGDTLTIQIIQRFLKYTSGRIQFDNDLAMELDAGRCTTLDVETILEKNKGTCSEYTNLFLALTRKAGIPSRMAVGYIFMPEQDFEGSHAWAECYIDNYGWLAVDPQNGFIWYPPVAIKLFHGKDFIDCNIKTLPDMYPVTMKIINNDL